MSWPNDADGDVFRRLESDGFDFTKSYMVDFNVDFDNWPPTQEAIDRLKSLVGEFQIFEPNEEFDGYLLFQVLMKLNYEKVSLIQQKVSEAMAPFGGVCESWGVLSDKA